LVHGVRRPATTPQGFFTGIITEARIWNVARTQTEIANNKDTRLTGPETGLVGYWPLDDGLVEADELIADPITLFQGRMDQMQAKENGDTATIALTLESNLIDLNKARERRYTDQDQKSDYPSDLFFEYVTGLQNKSITWGPDNRGNEERARDIARNRDDVALRTRANPSNYAGGYNSGGGGLPDITEAVTDEGEVLASFTGGNADPFDPTAPAPEPTGGGGGR